MASYDYSKMSEVLYLQKRYCIPNLRVTTRWSHLMFSMNLHQVSTELSLTPAPLLRTMVMKDGYCTWDRLHYLEYNQAVFKYIETGLFPCREPLAQVHGPSLQPNRAPYAHHCPPHLRARSHDICSQPRRKLRVAFGGRWRTPRDY